MQCPIISKFNDMPLEKKMRLYFVLAVVGFLILALILVYDYIHGWNAGDISATIIWAVIMILFSIRVALLLSISRKRA